jgi:hypothetical protein
MVNSEVHCRVRNARHWPIFWARLIPSTPFFFFFFFHWHYSPLWALACQTMSFHLFLSATNSLHLLTPSTWRSLSTSSFHLFLHHSYHSFYIVSEKASLYKSKVHSRTGLKGPSCVYKTRSALFHSRYRAWGITATPRPLTPGKETRYPLHRRLCGPRGWVCHYIDR